MDYKDIIRKAWEGYDSSKMITAIDDISASVSTNYVFRITFDDEDIIIAKLSNFGNYEHFKEDHRIIHTLSNNLLYPFENFLARSLLKNNRVYTYKVRVARRDVWVVFYNPTRVMLRLPRRLDEGHIRKFARQAAKFHKACARLSNVLPKSSKTLRTDINTLIAEIDVNPRQFGTVIQTDFLKAHCEAFLKNRLKFNAGSFPIQPVFIDWNIGNFSVNNKMEFYSRWDYDWFRMSSRMLDFYFFSRVVSDIGDRTAFSYLITPMMEDRFIIFLQEYHQVYPLTADEIRFLKEVYRFFILNYVIKNGKHFFNGQYANKLQSEAFNIYLPSIEHDFDAGHLISSLKLQ